MDQNPLQRFFRQPAIYIKLPSGGKFYPEGSLEMPVNEEIPVYPMTAMDEITYRTADALFNGSAVVNVIQSCVPNIKNAWHVPNVDMDTLLVAIRIATFGHSMDIDSVCPSCENENNFALDLRTVLDGLNPPDYSKPVDAGDLQIFFSPINYETANENAMAQFEDQKLLEILPEAEMPEEEKIKLLNQAFVKLGDLTQKALVQSISAIRVGEETVTNKEYIDEFVRNADRAIFNKIRDRVQEIRETIALKPLDVKCQNCGHEYSTPFTMDVSNFFG